MTSILILAGSAEATRLANVLVDSYRVDVLSSLAGATATPKPRSGRLRRGGFGGTEGLVDYLLHNPFDAVVDATHPFAAVMPFHVAEAAAITGIPSCRLLRPPWTPMPEDRWIEAADLPAAAAALGPLGARRVMLSVGRQSTWAFLDHDAWFLIRSIEPAEQAPEHHTMLLARGPFDLEAERDLLSEHGIDALVTKNSGGSSTEAKLMAARELGIPVVMVARPAQPEVTTVPGVDQAVVWLEETGGLESLAIP